MCVTVYVLLIEGSLCTEVAKMLMKDTKENHVITREPLQNSMNQKLKNEECMEDTKKIIARRKGRRRGKGNKVEKLPVAKHDEDVVSLAASRKSLMFHRRPGYGQLGTKCLVKANHFLANIPDSDICHYSVSVS